MLDLFVQLVYTKNFVDHYKYFLSSLWNSRFCVSLEGLVHTQVLRSLHYVQEVHIIKRIWCERGLELIMQQVPLDPKVLWFQFWNCWLGEWNKRM